MQRLLINCANKQKQFQALQSFCTVSEQDLFQSAFESHRNEQLSQNSPLRQFFNNQSQIQNLKEYNEYMINPEKYFEEQKESYKSQYGENFQNFYQRGFKFDVKGLKTLNKNPEIKTALFNNEFGETELRINSEELNQLENMNYLQIKQQEANNNFSHKISKDEHFSFALDNYYADEYVEKLKENQIIIFNLPQSSSQKTIQETLQNQLKIQGISQVEIVNNALGYPAFAKITLQDQNQAIETTNQLNQKEYLDDNHLINAVSSQDSILQNSSNRTLVVQGINPKASLSEILQKLNEYGSIMHFEMVEENSNPILPTKAEVLEFLEQNYKQNNFEIVEITAGTGKSESQKILPKIQEQSGQNLEQNGEFQNVGDLEINQQNYKNQKQKQIQQSIANPPKLYTLKWCSSLNSQQPETVKNIQQVNFNKLDDFEYIYSLLSSEEKQQIQDKIQNQRQYQNLGYCFVTYASVDQAKIAYLGLSQQSILSFEQSNYRQFIHFGGNWDNTNVYLKNETDHYHYDAQHLLNKFSDISSQYYKLVNTIEAKEDRNNLIENLEKKQEEIRQQILKENPTTHMSSGIKDTLQNQLFTDKNNQFEFFQNLDQNSIGRDFNSKATFNDIEEFKRKLQANQNNQILSQAESKLVDQNNLEQYYSQKLRSLGYENLVDPLEQLTVEQKKQILENLNQQHQKQVQQQLEDQQQEDIKVKNYEDQSRLIYRQAKRKNEKQQQSQAKRVQKIARKEERQGLANQDNAEFSVLNKNPKHKAYSNFIDQLKTMIIGDFESELRQQMFSQNQSNFQECRNNLGQVFIDSQEADRLFLYRLPRDQQKKEELLNQYKSHQDMVKIMPEQWVETMQNFSQEQKEQIQLLSYQYGIPLETFKVNLDASQNLDQYINELNLYAAEVGEEFKLIQNNEGENIIVKVLKQVELPNLDKIVEGISRYEENNQTDIQNKFAASIDAMESDVHSLDEVQRQLLLTFVSLGLSTEQAQEETFYFIKNQDYSPKVTQLMEKQLNKLSDEQIAQYCEETGMSRQDLEAILSFDESEAKMQNSLNSLQQQQEIKKSKALLDQATKEDLVKMQKSIAKDENDQYINTKFNQA